MAPRYTIVFRLPIGLMGLESSEDLKERNLAQKLVRSVTWLEREVVN